MRRDLVVRQHDLASGSFEGGSTKERLGRLRLPSALTRGLGLYCADTTEKVVVLTYDDGPDPAHTPGILDELARRGATATFFVLAPHVVDHPEIARRILAEGHELGLHGGDHRSLLETPEPEVLPSILRARRQVEDVVGAPVRLYRPPYGAHTPRQAFAIQRAGMDVVMWSAMAEDWLHDDEQAIADRALAGVRPGAILLFHDTRADPETLAPGEELPRFDRAAVISKVLDGLEASGYRTVGVGDLVQRAVAVRSLSPTRTRPA